MNKYPVDFKRNEEKFECSYSKAVFLKKKLKEFLVQDENPHRIYNLSFEDLDRIDFDNYSRIRVRKYYVSKKERGVVWVELRSIHKVKCVKQRFCINESELEDFINDKHKAPNKIARKIIGLKKKKHVMPLVGIDYLRTAFNSLEKKVRVTIDTDLSYYSAPVGNKFFKKYLGGDKVAIVKVKYIGKMPVQIRELTKSLSNKPLSKLQRALYFLGESK